VFKIFELVVDTVQNLKIPFEMGLFEYVDGKVLKPALYKIPIEEPKMIMKSRK